MKKFFLCLVFALISLLNINASSVNTTKFNVVNEYTEKIVKSSIDSIYQNIDKNFKPIYRYLDLRIDQIEDVYRIHNDVCNSINYLEENKNNGVNYFNNHIYWDLKNMSLFLNKEQYHKYLTVMNVTLVNKELINYITEGTNE